MTGSERQEEFVVGQVVFAKVKGYPHWPAVVQKKLPGGKFCIHFFGTEERAILSHKDLAQVTEETTLRIVTETVLKRRFYREGVEQMQAFRKESEAKSVNGADNGPSTKTQNPGVESSGGTLGPGPDPVVASSQPNMDPVVLLQPNRRMDPETSNSSSRYASPNRSMFVKPSSDLSKRFSVDPVTCLIVPKASSDSPKQTANASQSSAKHPKKPSVRSSGPVSQKKSRSLGEDPYRRIASNVTPSKRLLQRMSKENAMADGTSRSTKTIGIENGSDPPPETDKPAQQAGAEGETVPEVQDEFVSDQGSSGGCGGPEWSSGEENQRRRSGRRSRDNQKHNKESGAKSGEEKAPTKPSRKRKLEDDAENVVSNDKAKRSAGGRQGGSSSGELADQKQSTASKRPVHRKSPSSGRLEKSGIVNKPINAFAKLYNSPRRTSAPVRLPLKPAADARMDSAADIIEVEQVEQAKTKILEEVGPEPSRNSVGGSTRPSSRRSAPEKLLPQAAKSSKPTASKNSDAPGKSDSKTSPDAEASNTSVSSESENTAPVAVRAPQQNADDRIKIKIGRIENIELEMSPMALQKIFQAIPDIGLALMGVSSGSQSMPEFSHKPIELKAKEAEGNPQP